MNAQTLRERFQAARDSGKRAKDAAAAIGVSEGEAVAAHCGLHNFPPKAVQLRGDWLALLQALGFCGPLMALTRNESTVHEKTGIYQNISGSAHMGLALGHEIDLRLFLNNWHAGYAVTELAANPGNRASISLQFFDGAGLAVHKIFTREHTDHAALQAVVDAFADPSAGFVFRPRFAAPQPRPDEEIDAAALRAGWAAMQDTHEFFGLLKKHDVHRQQSFRLMQGAYTRPLAHHTVRDLLLEAAFDGLPIMCFVGNVGCIQIHTGPVKRIEPMDIRGVAWLNVIDPTFNLHLREDSIAHVWAVQKPTADGVVTSVEAFDAQGELMAMFFGARKPGVPELPAWQALVEKLCSLSEQPQEAAA